jgi:hypothetical protein
MRRRRESDEATLRKLLEQAREQIALERQRADLAEQSARQAWRFCWGGMRERSPRERSS